MLVSCFIRMFHETPLLIKGTYRLVTLDTRLATHTVNSILHGDLTSQKARHSCIYFCMPHITCWPDDGPKGRNMPPY